MQPVFADVKSEPHVTEVLHRHDRGTLTHQFAHLGVTGGDDAVCRRGEGNLFQIGIHQRHGRVGALHQGDRGVLIFLPGAVHRHVVLALGGTRGGAGGLVLGLHLVEFLVGNDLLLVQGLHTLIGLEHHALADDSLLPQLVGTGNLLLAGAVVGLVTLGHRSGLGGIRLGDLGADLRGVDDHQGIALADHLAFIGQVGLDTARNLAGHPVFRGFRFALQQGFLGF